MHTEFLTASLVKLLPYSTSEVRKKRAKGYYSVRLLLGVLL